MCGLTGFVARSGSVEGQLSRLRAMTDAIEHRGPDDEGHVLRGPFALGFRRLSIIDLAGGHQPIESADGQLAVMGNGEIYNFRALRRELEAKGARFRSGSDIETILHLYADRAAPGGSIEDAAAVASSLIGMYAFAIADSRDAGNPRLVLGRDRLGIKPLYWAETAEGIVFGSEVKCLLASGMVEREMRREALLDYLVQGYVGGPESAWTGVQRLEPGTVLTWSAKDGVRTRRYWDLPDGRAPGSPDPEEIRDWVDRVVEDRLVAEVPLGAFLSGGIDSSAVAHSMAQRQGEAPILCTVGFQEKSHDELGVAQATAARLGAVHHTEVLEPDPRPRSPSCPGTSTNPSPTPSTMPTWLVSRSRGST